MFAVCVIIKLILIDINYVNTKLTNQLSAFDIIEQNKHLIK